MKELLKQSGIYQIRNLVNGKIYVGSAKVLKNRRWLHLGHLARVTHHCQPLQRAYAKYGKASFSFEPLITCAPSMLIWYEQQFIDKLQPEYNVCKVAGNCAGRKHRVESIEKMRKVQKGRGFTDESKLKMSAGQKTKESLTLYTVNGVTKSMSEWSITTGISVAGLWGRIYKRNWSVEKALQTPLKPTPMLEYNGATMSLTEWSRLTGIKRSTIDERLKRGWSTARALTTGVA